MIYNAGTGQYVMWMHKENGVDYSQARAAVATSATVDGDYTYLGSFRPLGQHMSRDITVFCDDDGTAYMISAARENADLHIYRLTADYTGVAAWSPTCGRTTTARPRRCSSATASTSCSPRAPPAGAPTRQQYATATQRRRPLDRLRRTSATARPTARRPAYVLPVQGSAATSYLYLGDRWAGACGGPVNDSRYVWLPLDFPIGHLADHELVLRS